MVLLSYVILSHPDWSDGFIKIFNVCDEGKCTEARDNLNKLVLTGRLPITEKNIEVIESTAEVSFKSLVNKHSSEAGFTIVGFQEEGLKHSGQKYFDGYDNVGDILFVDAKGKKEIK